LTTASLDTRATSGRLASSVNSSPVTTIDNRSALVPIWSAHRPFLRAALATASCGTRLTSGMPPDSEIMSGREAAAKRSRTALERTPASRSA